MTARRAPEPPKISKFSFAKGAILGGSHQRTSHWGVCQLREGQRDEHPTMACERHQFVGSKCSAVCGLGLVSNLTAKIFQLERLSLFQVPQINDKRGKEGRKGAFLRMCGSQVFDHLGLTDAHKLGTITSLLPPLHQVNPPTKGVTMGKEV